MSLLFFRKLAEERIREAMENGDFEDLQCKGKPLDLKEDPFVPEELRVVYKILKNAGFLPKEVELRKEIAQLEKYLEEDTQDAYNKIKKLNALVFKLNQIRKTPFNIEDSDYYYKIVQKIKLSKDESKRFSRKKHIDWSKLQINLYISAICPRKK
jgi:seryl-tRNA synthetase